MRCLIPALIALMVLVPQAHSRLTILPTDDTAGGGSGDIYRFMDFGSNSNAWPDTDTCLSATGGGGSHRACSATDATDSRNTMPYRGQAFIRYLVCTPTGVHSQWTSGVGTLDLAVYEVQGSDTDADFVRKQIGGNLQFDTNDAVGVALTLVINLPTTLENGELQVKFAAVSTAPTPTDDNGFNCTIALTE